MAGTLLMANVENVFAAALSQIVNPGAGKSEAAWAVMHPRILGSVPARRGRPGQSDTAVSSGRRGPYGPGAVGKKKKRIRFTFEQHEGIWRVVAHQRP